MEEDSVYIVIRTHAFGNDRIQIVLPNEEMAKDYIATKDKYGYGGWRCEEHKIEHEF